MVLLTKHGQRRGKKRRKLNHSALKSEFRKALDNGISLGQATTENKDKILISYLQNIQDKSKYTYTKAKIYNGYVYIYNKNNKSLITIYECPEEIKRRVNK